MSFGNRAQGFFADRTGLNLLGGGAHFYNTYETKDGLHIAVAPIEPQFYQEFLHKMGLDDARWRAAGFPTLTAQTVTQVWPALKQELAEKFRERTRDEWCALFADSDACVTPVLNLREAAQHAHNRARSAFIEVDGVEQNAPAPRFSRTQTTHPKAPPGIGANAREVFTDWGIDPKLLPT
jgi:alpha-methylacyl-CoA racemase